MDWSNRFTLGGFTVKYCTFQMAWEVVDNRRSLEVVYRWFNTKEGAEAFGLKLISGRLYSDHQIKNKLINRTNE